MNVLFFSELLYPHGSGAELATYLYARMLAKSGIKTTVVTQRFANELEHTSQGDLSVYRLPLGLEAFSNKYMLLRKSNVLFSQSIRKIVSSADVVYIPKFWYSAIPLAKAFRKPVVLHFHDYFPLCPLTNLYNSSEKSICLRSICDVKCTYLYESAQEWSAHVGLNSGRILGSVGLNSVFGPFFRRLAERSDAIICVSRAQRDIVNRRSPRLGAKTHVIYNPMPDVPNSSIEENDFGYFGGPSLRRGFQTLVGGVGQFKLHTHRSIKIHSTKFPNRNKCLSNFLNKQGFVLYPRLNKEKFEEMYQSIRCVITPSVWPEPLPYVVCDALLKRRIVIASNTGGIPELVEGCPGTYLFPPGDQQQLANSMELVQSLSNETVDDLGSRNRTNFQKRFDNKRTLDCFLDVLSGVINQ